MQSIQAISPQTPILPKARRNNSVRTPWTGERVDCLIALWADGLGATCRQIAARLNELPGPPITEDAVIGKVWRLGLAPKDPLLRKFQTSATKRAARGDVAPTRKHVKTDCFVVVHKKSQPLPVFSDNVIPLRVPFALLDNQRCRYVVGEPRELIYCGHERDGESPWCADHRNRCTRPRR